MTSYPDFDSFWDYSNPGDTEIKFREILLQIPNDDPAHLELLTQIARSQGLQGKFEQAHETLDGIEKQLGSDLSRAKVRYLLERGRVFNSSGHPAQSGSFFEQALDMAQQLSEDFYAVDAIHMLAIVAPPASALTLNLRAIRRAETSQQEKARNWLGSLYNNMGWAYHDMGDFDSALNIFEKAEAWCRSKRDVGKTRIAIWSVARALRSLNRIEEALSKQMALKEEFESSGESDGYVFEEIGECFLALDRKQEARPYFKQAYELLSKDEFLVAQEPGRIERLKELGED